MAERRKADLVPTTRAPQRGSKRGERQQSERVKRTDPEGGMAQLGGTHLEDRTTTAITGWSCASGGDLLRGATATELVNSESAAAAARFAGREEGRGLPLPRSLSVAPPPSLSPESGEKGGDGD
ncbi:hypothetical protein E2562_033311 [Oryza meyeriana var. granulata]|uniref:DUF834 domain-containing protein n=1 Tax=Oryza meyeriana var. granulata TaxID=110450 RepID=A0A6G1F0Y8_9ORYZ|nr:hypothetical protein E2562_033311 [Oryza meyeriana var. granulata]